MYTWLLLITRIIKLICAHTRTDKIKHAHTQITTYTHTESHLTYWFLSTLICAYMLFDIRSKTNFVTTIVNKRTPTCRYAMVALAVWGRALSCWKAFRCGCCRNMGTTWACSTCWYVAALTGPLKKWSGVLWLQVNAAQTITLPPPKRSASRTQASAYLSPVLLHTLALPSDLDNVNLDSSLNRTPAHWRLAHLWCKVAHCKRRCLCTRVSMGPTYGRRACSPTARSRRWTVEADTCPLRPATWRAVDVVVWNRLRRCSCLIYASCLFVVTRGCPERGLSEVDPVLRSLSSKYSIVLTEQLNLVATTDAETLLCSMPMARSLSVCVKRGIYSTA